MKRLCGGRSWLGLCWHQHRGQQLARVMLGLSLSGLTGSCLPNLYQQGPAELFVEHDEQPDRGGITNQMFQLAWQQKPCARIVNTICVVKRMSWRWQALAAGRYMHELAYYPHGTAGLVQPFKTVVSRGQEEGALPIAPLLYVNEAKFDERGVRFVFNGLHELGVYDAMGFAQAEFAQAASGRWFISSYFPYSAAVMSAVMLEESFLFASHEVEPPLGKVKDGARLHRPEPRYEAGDLVDAYAALIHYQVNHQVQDSQRYSYRAMFYPHDGSGFRPQTVVAYMAGYTTAIRPQCGDTAFWSLCLLTRLTLYGDEAHQRALFDSAKATHYPYSVDQGSAMSDDLYVVFKDGKVYFLNQELGREGGYAVYTYNAEVDAALRQQQPTYFWGTDVSQSQHYDVFVRIERFYNAGRGGSRGHRCQYKGYFYEKDQPQNIVAYFRNTGSCCAKNHHRGHCSIAPPSGGESSAS